MDPRMMMQMGGQMGGGLTQFLGGMFGDSGAPFEAGMHQIEKYGKQGAAAQNPFLQAGGQALPQMQNWLQQQSNPSQFLNNMMSQYQQSPYNQFLQQQAMRAAQNAGSASGLTGSTPLMMQMQQNAGNIGQQGMNDWLQNMLGLNTQYGAGLGQMAGMGQGAANQLTNMYGNMGNSMAQGAYGQQAGRQQDTSNMIGGGLRMLTGGIFG